MEVDGYLRFADGLVDDVSLCRRTLTARYGLERRLDAGDVVELVDEDDDVFAIARLLSAYETTVSEFVTLTPALDGYPTYISVGEYCDVLGEHYPAVTFGEQTPVTVVRFEVVALVE